VPTVKVTGGQRIDLLGREEGRPAGDVGRSVAAGMPSGHAYGKSLRTVKTCVGAEHCRFGTQSRCSLGVTLEKMLFGMWSPHKVKLAVSGCPRNCAEAGIKDVGVIGVDSGYEIYVAGNGGIKTEVAQFLCKVATRRRGDGVTGRLPAASTAKKAHYLERTVHYIDRVGMDYVKGKVVEDAENRKALYERLLFALQDYKDPWLERAQADTKSELGREFRTIAIRQAMQA
jgi:nitrite reductase (NADH) large subunit